MQVVLNIDRAMEARVRDLAAKGEFEAAKRALDAPLDTAVRQLAIPQRLSSADFHLLSEELVRFFGDNCAPDAKPLSPEALTREGIYGEHP